MTEPIRPAWAEAYAELIPYIERRFPAATATARRRRRDHFAECVGLLNELGFVPVRHPKPDPTFPELLDAATPVPVWPLDEPTFTCGCREPDDPACPVHGIDAERAREEAHEP